MTNILYIAGYGRSGSTIVDLVLGNHPEICSLGEVGFLIEEYTSKDRNCACGEPYQQCEFWKSLIEKFEIQKELYFNSISNHEANSPFSRFRNHTRNNKEAVVYRMYCELFLNHLEKHSSAKVFIDSTKTARAKRYRPLLLSRHSSANVYVLHLVRNGKSVTESLINKGSNWAMEGYNKGYKTSILRTVTGWITANVWALSLQLVLPKNRYLRIKFEDFQTDPIDTVNRICNWCELDPKPLTKKIKSQTAMKVGHMVGGNRIRHSQNIKLQTPDSKSAGSKLKRSHKFIFACTAGPLNRFLGFK